VFGATALLVLYGIGSVMGGADDAPDGAGPTSSPSAPTETATPTERPTAEPTTELGRAPIGATTTGQVVHVVDGDTIKVEVDGEVFTVRYIGIDTPETVDPSSPVEWMGAEASAANTALVEGREVVLEKDVSEVDRFDRLLRYVWLQQGTGWLLVNFELVRLGFANSATYPPDVLYQELFLEAERDARNADRGLWSATPTPSPTLVATPPPTPVPTLAPTAAPPPPANCDPSYPAVCIPPYPPDLDCGEIAFRNFDVLPPDPHGFDGDNDGIGCES
jgi:micrococcal nuclease